MLEQLCHERNPVWKDLYGMKHGEGVALLTGPGITIEQMTVRTTLVEFGPRMQSACGEYLLGGENDEDELFQMVVEAGGAKKGIIALRDLFCDQPGHPCWRYNDKHGDGMKKKRVKEPLMLPKELKKAREDEKREL